MASQAVLKYLTDHNRPFSASQVQQAIAGDFGKAAIQKALDALVEEEEVKEKAYGKQKVYFVIQRTNQSAADLRDSLLEMDRKNKRNSQGKMTLEEAVDQKSRLQRELEEVNKQLEEYSETTQVCPERKLQAESDYEKFLSEYKKRKRMCMDVVNSILENYPKSKKQLFEDIGMETDEDVGFSLDKL
ncbi:hypothetical protein NQ318_005359 [Aromia moschata]|uniref:Homologous-pairing protein 2 homolog n=1 Tax=Aromia moschata TaxID=1265417 RepID=A0AAV8YX98_9CUCU|nr:hypothetical protein NQ318_005359 [Aromia moschata]